MERLEGMERESQGACFITKTIGSNCSTMPETPQTTHAIYFITVQSEDRKRSIYEMARFLLFFLSSPRDLTLLPFPFVSHEGQETSCNYPM